MYKRKRMPTQKQTTAMKLISQGIPTREAMRKAGYKESTVANAEQNLLKRANFLQLIDQLNIEMPNVGINARYLAEKIKSFMDAEKGDQADYQTQLKAVEILMKAQTLNQKKDEGNIKRKIELTEYLDNPQ